MSTPRWAKPPHDHLRGKLGPHGRPFCRWCGNEIREKARRLWCSQRCVDEYLDLSDSARRRARVLRDFGGHCALCKVDLVAIEKTQRAFGFDGAGLRAYNASLVALGWPAQVRDRVFEIDHVIPLADGGEHGFKNLRPLCLICHRAETAKLMASLAERKRTKKEALKTSLDESPK